jgi:hypothetical protein
VIGQIDKKRERERELLFCMKTYYVSEKEMRERERDGENVAPAQVGINSSPVRIASRAPRAPAQGTSLPCQFYYRKRKRNSTVECADCKAHGSYFWVDTYSLPLIRALRVQPQLILQHTKLVALLRNESSKSKRYNDSDSSSCHRGMYLEAGGREKDVAKLEEVLRQHRL